MSEEYVRKDTFEAVIQELRAQIATSNERQDMSREVMTSRHESSEARMERTVMEIRAGNETFKSEVRGELSTMRNEISDMKRMLSSMHDTINNFTHFFGLALSIVSVIFTALQIYIALK